MFHFELSEKMLGVISEALGRMPYVAAAPVVEEMNKQIRAQLQNKSTEEPASHLRAVGPA
jgi:hypothetical protein